MYSFTNEIRKGYQNYCRFVFNKWWNDRYIRLFIDAVKYFFSRPGISEPFSG